MPKLIRTVPTELKPALAAGSLSTIQTVSVLDTYQVWRTSGMSQRTAVQQITKLVKKISQKRRAQIRRTQGTPMSRVAARHEREFNVLVLTAMREAQDSVSIRKLESALKNGSSPWEVMNPVIQQMADTLLNG